MTNAKLTHLHCKACNGSGEVLSLNILTGLKIGQTVPVQTICRMCHGKGQVPNDFRGFPTRRQLFANDAPLPFDVRLLRLADEIAQLEDLCDYGVITSQEFGEAIRDLLNS